MYGVNRTALAWTAMALTILIWSGYLVIARAMMTTALGPVEIGLLRFLPATLLFAPVLVRNGPMPGGAGWRDVTLIALSGGFLFIICLAAGMKYATVADAVIFTPSMLPFYVACLAYVFLGETLSGKRKLGLAMIIAGAAAVGCTEILANSTSGAWRGYILFTMASIFWAIYTVRYRVSVLGPINTAAMICFWSTLALLVTALFTGLDFSQLGPQELLTQVVLQGVLTGFLSTLTYVYAIRELGATRPATWAALVPVLAILGGWAYLGETLTPFKWIAVVVVSLGVALASGLRLRRRSTDLDSDR
ncbi:MAG: DMT family transporter [Rhodobacteraceae bacterium]|nr:DMT family transporter [Paracoccaceae bacterium]